ncbi:MAG: methyltransferase domain-containing protein [Bacteroidia bacterium]|nr:methyltransferase domain-containing protein [Bacteroidia bacterium]NNF30672.1 methyltransferase domain-containing protein [Flavobacteriaceae bacterium]NNM07936.1 methyltransferase domain-containing protein [Flavobacteriaceae bacterium]
MKKEATSYILGTDKQELIRLGIQHQVWAEEAQHGWAKAGFTAGDTLLDLGSGPGYCTREMACIAGESGTVIGVDKSEGYIHHLNELSTLQHLNIKAICADFNEMQLEPNSIDGMYCRWALAWLPNPKEILQKVYNALKPGGKMVIHEYYDWSTHQTEPKKDGLSIAIAAALKSFRDSEGEIDIGRHLPEILSGFGMQVPGVRLMAKIGRPDTLNWQWPKTFYYSYFPRLVEVGYLSETHMKQAFDDLQELEQTPGSSICCPLMTEVIAIK